MMNDAKDFGSVDPAETAGEEPVEENIGAPVMEADELDAISELQNELLAAQAKADEYLEGWNSQLTTHNSQLKRS